MRDADANETSGELGSAFGGTLVGLQIQILYSFCDRTHLFPSDLGYHIYTIPFIPLSFRPYFSQIFHCLVLHIILHLHISFYYAHCSFLLIQHISCLHPSSHHQVIVFTLKGHMDLCFFCPIHTEIIIIFPFNSFRTTGRQPPLTINLTLATTLPFTYLSFFG